MAAAMGTPVGAATPGEPVTLPRAELAPLARLLRAEAAAELADAAWLPVPVTEANRELKEASREEPAERRELAMEAALELVEASDSAPEMMEETSPRNEEATELTADEAPPMTDERIELTWAVARPVPAAAMRMVEKRILMVVFWESECWNWNWN